MSLTPAQCRAARGLMNLSQGELAQKTGLSTRTIMEFETGKSKALASTKTLIRLALEAEGVELIGDRGVQLRDPTGKDAL